MRPYYVIPNLIFQLMNFVHIPAFPDQYYTPTTGRTSIWKPKFSLQSLIRHAHPQLLLSAVCLSCDLRHCACFLLMQFHRC